MYDMVLEILVVYDDLIKTYNNHCANKMCQEMLHKKQNRGRGIGPNLIRAKPRDVPDLHGFEGIRGGRWMNAMNTWGGNAGIHTHTDTIRVFPRWLETPTR